MHRVVALLALSAILVTIGCNQPSGSNFDDVAVGMTRDEVAAILGAPTSTRRTPEEELPQIGYAERWQYGDSLSTLATNAIFTEAPDGRVYVVFFDEAGRVLETRRPIEPFSLPPPSGGDPTLDARPAWRRDVWR